MALFVLKILAIDTSAISGSVAVTDGEIILAERSTANVGTHSEWLLKAMDVVLIEAGLSPGEIDLIALANGPGSFTGLRIGVAVVKGLAWSAGKKVFGVSSLEVLAMGAANIGASMEIRGEADLSLAGEGTLVCPILDARKKEVYAALFRLPPGPRREGSEEAPEPVTAQRVMEDSVLSPEALFERVSKEAGQRGRTIFLGQGLQAYRRAIEENVPGAVIAPEPMWHARAVFVAALARKATEEGTGKAALTPVGPESLTPVYLRRSEAELKKAGHRPG